MPKNRSKKRRRSSKSLSTPKPNALRLFLNELYSNLQLLFKAAWSEQDASKDGELYQNSRYRIYVTTALLLICYFFVMVKASTLMLFDDKRLAEKARTQFDSAETIQGRRGDILDRNGEILATSVTMLNVILDPSMIAEEDIPLIVQAIASVADIDAADLSKRIRRSPNKRYLRVLSEGSVSPVRITSADVAALRDPLNYRLGELRKAYKDEADDEKKKLLKARIKEFRSSRNAIFFIDRQYRYYPDKSSGAPLLGLIRQTQARLVGASGAERLYEEHLKGDIIRVVHQRDRRNNALSDPESDLRIPDSYHGKNVILTLDRRIQHITDRAVKKALEVTEASAAYAVVMDVTTGEILAMSSHPTQNLNDTLSIDMNLLRNHAALSLYEPGSVLKPFVAAGALNEGLYKPSSVINCENGRWYVPGKTITDEHPIGESTITGVIQYSSNICAAKMAFQLGADRTIGYIRDFGFGRKSGLNFPSEPKGFVGNPQTIRPVELATTSYGYGINATVLQIASAYATLGNHGVRMKPMLLKGLSDMNGQVLMEFEPEIDREVVSPRVADQVVEMMVQVVEDGTAKRAKVPGYYVGGKTGTAKKLKPDGSGYSDSERIGSFAGLIPANDPKLAIVVTVDNPTKGLKFGGIVAAPAFAEIALASMKTLGIEPSPELLDPTDSTVQTEEKWATQVDEIALTLQPNNQALLPDLTGLSYRDAMTTLSQAKLKFSFIGSGVVKHQEPPAGTPFSSGDHVEVQFN